MIALHAEFAAHLLIYIGSYREAFFLASYRFATRSTGSGLERPVSASRAQQFRAVARPKGMARQFDWPCGCAMVSPWSATLGG